MDGREGMSFQGSASYYLNRGGIGGSGGPVASPNVHGAGGGSVFNIHSSPSIAGQPKIGVESSSVSSSTFLVGNPSQNFSHGVSMAMMPSESQPQGGESVKKKRGRPRKYGPEKSNMSLGLSPLSSSTPFSDEISPGERKRRGRPPGSGWKQQLAPLGEWMNSTAGLAFTPHVLHIGVGEDIAAKVLSFSQQRPRALCILSANGSVSTVTLRQPTSAGTVTYEGRFEILCLSGSYLVDDSAGPRIRTGGISISFSNPDGRMLGGAIGGKLIAANPVQVVACSFTFGSAKVKTKTEPERKEEKYQLEQSMENPLLITPNHLTSGANVWSLDSRSDTKNSHSGFDLTRG